MAENDPVELPCGRYRHYKGNMYDVIGVARHSETEEPFVVYRCLYDGGSLWVRPLSLFTDTVCIDGREMRRFMPCGDDTSRPSGSAGPNQSKG